jgi:membrane fusion protein, multidrug efflux system
MNHLIFRAAAVALVLMISACAKEGVAADKTAEEKDAKAAAEAAIPVEVAAPLRGEMLAMYSGTATLEAEADAEVIAKVGGEVRRLLVEEGDRVKAGQVLAQLDDRQLRLQAAQTRAALAKAERDFNRQVELHDKGLVSAGAFEGLKYDLDNQRAADDLARLNLSYSEIRAPFSGVVSMRHVKMGQEIAIGAKLFRVTDPTPLKASVFIPERELARLKPGQSATIAVDALAGRAFPAIVKLVSPTVDAATATFKVTLEVDDPQGDLKPGMFSRVGIVFERRSDTLTIPRVALIDTDGSANVFVVTAGKAEQRPVKTGLSHAGKVEITEGLQGGEQIVVVGQNGLKDGNPVRVVSLEQTAQAGAGKKNADKTAK